MHLIMLDINNILADIPAQLPEELSTCLLQNDKVHIERIVYRCHASAKDKWYDQAQDEWVLLLQGEAHLEFSGQIELKKLQAGDYFWRSALQISPRIIPLFKRF